jgi:hypothetical protein
MLRIHLLGSRRISVKKSTGGRIEPIGEGLPAGHLAPFGGQRR